MIQFHTHPFSTYARRVHMLILEKQLNDIEIVTIDMAKGEHKKAQYLALNPYGRIPSLTDDDLVLSESAAIMEYLEEKYPQNALLPSDLSDRALVRMHMKLCDIEYAGPSYIIIFSKRFVPQDKWRIDEMATSQKQIQKHYEQLDKALDNKTYLVGETLTLADLSYAPFLHFSDLLDLPLPDNIARYKERLLSRESAKQTLPPM